MSKSAILTIDGQRYNAVYDRMCNQGGYKSRAFRWFVWKLFDYPDQEYIGDFASLVKAEIHIRQAS